MSAIRKTARPSGVARRRLAAVPEPRDSRERIHRAALRLFARYGYDAVSLQMIADEVGLHKSTLFHHYEGKLQIADEVLNEIVQRVVTWVERVNAEDPPVLESFLRGLEQLVDYFADEPDAARLLVMAMSAPRDHELVRAGSAERVIAFYSGLSTWFDRARKAGVIRRVSIRQAIPNLMGIVLFYPAVAGDLGALMGPEPFSPRARQVRKEELRRMLVGLLSPT